MDASINNFGFLSGRGFVSCDIGELVGGGGGQAPAGNVVPELVEVGGGLADRLAQGGHADAELAGQDGARHAPAQGEDRGEPARVVGPPCAGIVVAGCSARWAV